MHSPKVFCIHGLLARALTIVSMAYTKILYTIRRSVGKSSSVVGTPHLGHRYDLNTDQTAVWPGGGMAT